MTPQYRDLRRHAAELIGAALTTADPRRLVLQNLSLEGHALRIGGRRFDLSARSQVFVVAIGKAAAAMSEAAAQVLGSRLTRGIATLPPGAARPDLEGFDIYHTGHPLPDEGSLEAGLAAQRLLAGSGPEDLLLALVSGGGSAMFELLPPGVLLTDLRATTDLLLRAGAPIEATNIVRRRLSQVKDGGLARMAAPARVASLILSDVPGDDPAAVASGPTLPSRVPLRRARDVLHRYNVQDEVPTAVRIALSAGQDMTPTTPHSHATVIGTNRMLVGAVRRQALQFGFPVRVLTWRMQGEAARVGENLGSHLAQAPRPMCLLMGGETTVTVRGRGRGGRNQELALAAARQLQGVPGAAVLAFASDGVDGPTQAAGALVTGKTLAEARRLQIDPERALQDNDAFPCLESLDALLFTGPTGTNLNDVVVGLAYRK